MHDKKKENERKNKIKFYNYFTGNFCFALEALRRSWVQNQDSPKNRHMRTKPVGSFSVPKTGICLKVTHGVRRLCTFLVGSELFILNIEKVGPRSD